MRKMRLGFPRIAFLPVATSLIFIISSCTEDPTFLGRNLLPPSDDMRTLYMDSTQIRSYSEEGQPILTASNSTLLLGSLHDSIFGFSKADLMAKFDVSPRNIEAGFSIDSMVLELSILKHFGDTSLQTVRVYALTDTLLYDSAYRSNTLPTGKYDPVEIAVSQVKPNDTLARFNIMSDAFIQKFEAVDDSVFSDGEDFSNFFLGFYITTDDVEEEGSIIYLDIFNEETRFLMYYQDDDTSGTKQLFMGMNEYSARVNTFYHDYAGSRVESSFSSSATQDTLAFISSMAGVCTKLYFPEIESWLDKKPVAINKAELILPVEDTLLTGYVKDDFPLKLLLFSYDEDEYYYYTYDYRVDNTSSKTFYDGNFDQTEYAYVFNLGVHLQSYIQGDIDNLNLVLISSLSQASATRAVLKGPAAKGRKMQLRITYTEF